MSTVPPAPSGGGILGSDNIGGFGYGIGVSVGILLIITTITMASYFCTRAPSPVASVARHRPQAGQGSPECIVEVGLDEVTLLNYPKLFYSQVKSKEKDSTATCCSICLADYKGSDTLRLLPDCGHLFHLKCVDPWLMQHPTCPVCRTSPLPTPMATPLAEVTAFASRSG